MKPSSLTDQQYDYVDKEINEDLICSVCLSPFVNPYSHIPCGNTFCAECIANVVNCPMCSEPDFKKNCAPSIKSIRSMLDKLKVKCGMCNNSNILRGEFRDHQEKYCPLHDAYKQVEELKLKVEREFQEQQKELKEKHVETIKKLHVEKEQYLKKAMLDLQQKEAKLMQQVKEKEEILNQRIEQFENRVETRQKLEMVNKPIHLNIRGTIMTVALGVFIHNEREPDNLFKKMFTQDYPLYQTPCTLFKDEVYFIDIDPQVFKHILDYLSYGVIGNDLSGDMKQVLLCACNKFGINNIAKELKYREAQMSQHQFMNTINLSRSQKTKLNLSGLDLTTLVLNNTNLQNAEIIGSNFSGMNLKHTDFKGSNLRGSNFSNCNLYKVNFTKCELGDCDFSNTISKDTIISDLTELSDGTFENAKFEKCKLKVYFKKDNNWKNCKFIACNFDGSTIEEFDFVNSNSSTNVLNGITLKNIDLRGKDLSKFKRCKFQSCIFDFTQLAKDYTQHNKCTLQLFDSNIIEDSTFPLCLLELCYITKSVPELLYRGTRDGLDSRTFHSLCDYKGPTLTIIKSNHDQIFGGFTTQSWESTGEKRMTDESAFIYKIEKNSNQNYQFKKFNIKQDRKQYAITNNQWYGPHFGDILIFLGQLSSATIGCNYELPNDIKQGSEEANNYLAGSHSFEVKEIEVFRIQQQC